ncbi:uncharacterized protein LOC121385502 [Gigantopelta aegis]|uniref:uncharacterized protein LOC121385502 n=1 Tax=Gigantopelta aegis TaxID=1735272 RepID=UPI001B889BD6|nr:uncharacterized protein LOC121385502 [Gigantopelta aegis]
MKMNSGTLCVRFVVLCVVLIHSATSGLAFKCYTCSYNRAGTGVTDYECVNATLSKLHPIACTSPKVCTVKTTYRQTFGVVQSLVRNCLAKENIVTKLNETACTIPDGHGGADCYFQCDSDLCNVVDGNLYVPKGPGDSAPGLSSLLSVFTLMLLTVTLSSVAVY